MNEDITESAIYDEACSLVFALHDQPSDLAKTRIETFKSQSAQHQAAVLEAEKRWQLLGKLPVKKLSLPKKFQLHIELKALSLKERPLKALPAVAAILIILFMPKIGLLSSVTDVPVVATNPVAAQAVVIQTYKTPYGKQAEHILEDGSVLLMNWSTEVHIAYSKDSRLATLVKGEALFTVAKNLERPFIVSVDNIQAQAVGTEFSVQKVDRNYANIAVTEGIVEVSMGYENSQASSVKQLLANQALIAKDNTLGSIQSFSIDEISAWRNGMLAFEERPLEEVLSELDRYTGFNIVAENLSSVQQKVTATFFIDEAEDSLRTLATAFNLQIETLNNTRVATVVIKPARPVRPK